MSEEPAAWDRWFWLWDLYVAAAYAGVLVLVMTNVSGSWAVRVVSLFLLTASVLLYAVLGRRVVLADESSPRQTAVFVAGMLVLYMVAIVVFPANSFSLFWICPLLFMAVPTRLAVVLVIVLNLTPMLGGVLHGGDATTVFTQLAPVATLTLALSVFLSLWIERIVSQSSRRAELIKELEASKAEVARLSHEAGVAAERARLAGEIHDTLAQGFTSIITLVQAAESEMDDAPAKARGHLDLAARTARDNLEESRALVAALAPFALGEGSLEDALRRQVARLAEETALEAVFRTSGPGRPLPTAVEVVLLRAAQEALANVRRHARATVVRVELAFAEASVRLAVCDDGAGYDRAAPTGGFGLRGMRARAGQVAGTLTVRGTPGEGTTLELEVPA